jgi:hypothetical protein
MQVWQTPDQQLQRVGTSQASASSSTLRRLVENGAEMPLRAKVTSGPLPGGPGGWWGARWGCPARPGLSDGNAASSSVWMLLGSTPIAVSARFISRMKEAGPQR